MNLDSLEPVMPRSGPGTPVARPGDGISASIAIFCDHGCNATFRHFGSLIGERRKKDPVGSVEDRQPTKAGASLQEERRMILADIRISRRHYRRYYRRYIIPAIPAIPALRIDFPRLPRVDLELKFNDNGDRFPMIPMILVSPTHIRFYLHPLSRAHARAPRFEGLALGTNQFPGACLSCRCDGRFDRTSPDAGRF